MKYLYCLFFLFHSMFSMGQSGGQSVSAAGGPANQISTGLIASNNRFGSIVNKGFIPYEEVIKEYESIDGSPYLHEGEILVDLTMANDSILRNVPLRYDQYNNELIVPDKTAEDAVVVLDQQYYKSFQYNNGGTMEHYQRLSPNDNTYYRVLFQAEGFVFCKAHEVTLAQSTRHVPGVDLPKQSFNQRATYLVMQNNALSPVKLRNGEAISFFPSFYAEQVPGLQKSLRIKKLRKEEDYIRLMAAFEHPEKL